MTRTRRVIRGNQAIFVVLLVLSGWSQADDQASSTLSTEAVVTRATARAPHAFYEPPTNVPKRPGVLLRSEPIKNVSLAKGMRGWRILYTTTVNDKTPATAVATVFAPVNPPVGPLPVIAWQHGTTGLVQRCMPSHGSEPMFGIPGVDQIVKAGWAIVATDYSFAEKDGPQPYLIGEAEARSALDSVRAARMMSELKLDSRTVVWGHSQGGHSALWTGIIGRRYAPDVEINGVVGIAPPGDILDLLSMSLPLDRRLGPYIAVAYSRFYPEITFEEAVRPEAQIAAREISKLCSFIPPEDPKRIAGLLKTFEGPALSLDTSPALHARLKQNAADQRIKAPLLIVQGLSDAVVLPVVTRAYVAKRCAAGQALEYWTFAGQDHSTITQSGTALPERLVAWTKARFANEPQANGCTRLSH